MAYCTQAEIETRIGEEELIALADLDEDGTADAATVSAAISDACGYMDSYLQKKFIVPIPAPYPPAVVNIAISLSVCQLQLGRDSMTDDHKKACDDARQWLMEIVSGTVDIGLLPKPAEGAGAPTVEYDVQPRVFGRGEPL